MSRLTERSRCTGCGVCGAVCGSGAIRMRPDREGFLYPEIDSALCIGCGKCTEVCPVLQGGAQTAAPVCYGVQAGEGTRAMGSSGGMFPLLASHILDQGGAVFGAALLEGGVVRHICVRGREALPQITRTKYVQSDLSQVWEELRLRLREGPVLFCGTPCQTDAVRAYLGEDRSGAILVDLICYGVPSPGVWGRYVKYLEKTWGGPLQEFTFRDKRAAHGRACSFRIGKKERVRPLGQDPFCRTYFKNVNIRPACFQCRYATVERSSDLTLGDFWGIDGVRPGFDDGAGCSVVLCHTPAGARLWDRVKGEARWFQCRPEDAANEAQPRLNRPVQPSPRRSLLMQLYGRIPFRIWLRLASR